MRRVMIIGAPGSGKSTLARALGDRLGLPVHHMDHIHHLPGWVQRPTPDRVAMARAVEEQEAWVFEGGLSLTYPTRTARADLVLFLDLPVWQRLWRVARRIRRYHGTVRPDMAPGCPEQVSLEFLWWIVSTARRNRARDAALIAALPPGKGLTLRSQRAIDRFLADAAAL